MPTDNHGLNIPPEGTTDWHVPLNENFESIDSILKNISADGTTFTPSTVKTDEISLGGETRTSWESLYSTDPTVANDKIIVADTAEGIQTALDTLDGLITGYDDSGKASRPGGGMVMLKRKEYRIDEPITLRKGTQLVGIQPDMLLGKNNHEFQYCVIRPSDSFTGDALIKTTDENHVGAHNVHLAGRQQNIYGIYNTAGTSYYSNVTIYGFNNPGYYNGGKSGTAGFDNWLESCIVKNCGDSTSPAVELDEGFRWLYGRISNDDGYSAVVTKSGSGLVRFMNVTIKSSATPASSPMPVINHGGNLLETTNCVIDGYNGGGSYGIQQTANNQVRLNNLLIEKADIGLYLDGNTGSALDSIKIRTCNRHGIYVNSRAGQWDRIDIQSPNESGIVVDGANPSAVWSNVRVSDWDSNGDGTGYALDVRGVKGGKPGDVVRIQDLDIGTADPLTAINNPELVILNGEWVQPYTYSLGGSSGSVSISDKPANPTSIRIDAGSNSANLRGIDGRTVPGSIVVVERTGSNQVVLEHDNGSAANPLLNQSGTDETLVSPGSVAAYRYDTQSGAWRQVWSNIA